MRSGIDGGIESHFFCHTEHILTGRLKTIKSRRDKKGLILGKVA